MKNSSEKKFFRKLVSVFLAGAMLLSDASTRASGVIALADDETRRITETQDVTVSGGDDEILTDGGTDETLTDDAVTDTDDSETADAVADEETDTYADEITSDTDEIPSDAADTGDSVIADADAEIMMRAENEIMPADAASDDAADTSANTTYSSDLTTFLDSVVMKNTSGETVDTATATVYVGDTYYFSLHFSETNSRDNRIQFAEDADGYMTYTLSAAEFEITEYANEQPIVNSRNKTIGYYTLVKNSEGKYVLKVRFLSVDDDGNATDKKYFENSSFTQFTLDIQAKVKSATDKIQVDFTDKIHISVNVSTESGLDVKKSATYKDYASAIDYSYMVWATKGTVDSVVSTDTPGSYLSIDESTIKVYSADGNTLRTDITASLTDDGKIVTSPVTLSAGEGFVVKYTAKVDFNKYMTETGAAGAKISFNADNSVSVTGTDRNGGTPSGEDTVTTPVYRTLTAKASEVIPLKDDSGTPAYYDADGNIVFGGGDTSRPVNVIKWTATVKSPSNYDMISNVTYHDILGSGLTVYTGKPLEIVYKEGAKWGRDKDVYVSWDDITVSKADGLDTFAVALPGTTNEYTIIYYTLYSGTGRYYNYAYTRDDMGDITEAHRDVSGESAGITKEITDADEDYIYFRIIANIPAGYKGKSVYVSDTMNFGGQRADAKQFEDETLTLKTASGEVINLTPYSADSTSCTYEKTADRYLNTTYWFRDENGSKTWVTDEASTLTITYKISKNAVNKTGATLHQALRSGTLSNSTTLSYNGRYISDTVYYSENEGLLKSGQQTGDKILYTVNFNNVSEGRAVSGSNQSLTKTHILPESFSGAYLSDTFDSKLTLVTDAFDTGDGTDYAIMAIVYPENTDMDGPEDWQARGAWTFVCAADDVKTDGNTMTADWADFHYVKNGVVDTSSNLETLMQTTLKNRCIQFVYYMKPVNALSETYIAALTNTAKVGWNDTTDETNPVEYTTAPAYSATDYNAQIIDKSGDLRDGNVMDYKITVNENGDNLTDGAALTIEDVMTANLALDYSSIKIRYPFGSDYYDNYSSLTEFIAKYSGTYSENVLTEKWNTYTAAAALGGYTYDAAENKITFTIPDNITLEISYTAKITETGDEVEISNIASLAGYEDISSIHGAVFSISQTTGSGSSKIEHLTVLKQDADTKSALSGAVFALYGPNDSTKNATPTDSSIPATITTEGTTLHYYASFTTGADGNLEGTYILNDNDYMSDGGLYTLKEVRTPAGYLTADDVSFWWNESKAGSVYPVYKDAQTLVVADEVEKTSATVIKVWDDAENNDGKRPTSLTVKLMNGETVVTTVTLDESNGWTQTVENLPVYTDGVKNDYTWSEGEMPDGYTLKSQSTDGTVTTITNTCTTEKTSATVKKVWDDSENNDGKRPTSLTVKLMNGETVVTTVTLDDSNGWTQTVENLPVYTDGVKNDYTWSEGEMPDGYTLKSQSTEGTVTTITNTYTTEKTSATVKKVWDDAENNDGKRPTEITVTLKNGNETVTTVTLNEENGWTQTVENLPVYTNRVKNVYSWAETLETEGYSMTNIETEGTVTTITNSYTPGKVSASVMKIWDDTNNKDGTRPTSLTVTLMNGGTAVATVTLTKDNNWTETVNDLPEYTQGVKNVYTWAETDIPKGYTLTFTETNGTLTSITNYHKPVEIPPESPDTGDTTDMTAMAAVNIVSAILLAAVILEKKKITAEK